MGDRSAGIYNFSTARSQAQGRLPPVLFDFIDGGADDEVTIRENRRAFEKVTFRPRSAVFVPEPRLATTVLGAELSLPVVLAPVGGIRLVYPDGARVVARAAGEFGTAAVLSTASGTPPEDIVPATRGPIWFQLYFRGNQDAVEVLIDKVQRVGYGALFVSVDSAARGSHERIQRYKAMLPLQANLRNALHFGPQLIRRPGWTFGYIRDGFPTEYGSFPGEGESMPRPASPGVVPKVANRTPTWEDMTWIRAMWKGRLVAKGILTGDDARRAMDCGADAVVVSNHGGRQLDGAPPTLRVLSEVREAIGTAGEVLIDSGIRRGADVVKAMALGADAVMIGRPYVFGLGAAGGPGVTKVLHLFHDEMTRVLRLLGRKSVDDIDETAVDASRI